MVDGELCEQIQYYHRISVVTLVSSAFPIPIGIRFQKNGESEVACSLALLKELLEALGRRFLDLLVADALYLQAPFIAALEALGLDWVINLKDNQPELLAEARRILPDEGSADPQELQLWHAPEVYWPVSDRTVGVVKTVRRIEHHRQRTIGASGPWSGAEGAHLDSRIGLYAHPGVLSSPGAQPLQKLFSWSL
jgi:hypothetical protein